METALSNPDMKKLIISGVIILAITLLSPQITKLWETALAKVPVGYEDETGFHLGTSCV